MKSTCLCLILVLTIASQSLSDIIHVPGDQPTIQPGIDAVSDGDTVLVADGTYKGAGNSRNLDLKGKAITSENGILDGKEDGGGNMLSFVSSETEKTIVNGKPTGHLGYVQNPQSGIPLTGSYLGESLLHPGIYLGSEYSITGNFVTSFGIGSYLHYKHHHGFLVSGDINWRKTFSCGYGLNFGIGIGYLHTWPHGGKIYTVDDNGTVDTKTNWGKPSFMPSLKLGLLSWDFRRRSGLPLRLFSDIIIFGEYPYNDYIMPHAALNFGATYYFKEGNND